MAWNKISDTNPFAQTIDVSTDIIDPPIARWSVVPMQWAHDGDVIKAAVVAYKDKSKISKPNKLYD